MAAKSKSKRVFVVGTGLTKFERPLTKNWDYPDMGKEAGLAALKDAGLTYDKIQSVVASYCYGEPTCGQRAVYQLGLTGVPVYNVNNNCSSGSTALMMARRLIQSGVENCVLALGFEKMERGLSERYTDKASPVGVHMDHMVKIGAEPGLIQPRMNNMTSDVVKLYAYAAREYMKKFPQTKLSDFIEISYKNHKQSVNNPKASISKEIAKEDIGCKLMLCDPITFWMSAPVADGGAAVIVCSEEFMLENNLQNRMANAKVISPKVICAVCKMSLALSKYEEHILKCITERPRCDICGKTFKKAYYAKLHRARQHEKKEIATNHKDIDTEIDNGNKSEEDNLIDQHVDIDDMGEEVSEKQVSDEDEELDYLDDIGSSPDVSVLEEISDSEKNVDKNNNDKSIVMNKSESCVDTNIDEKLCGKESVLEGRVVRKLTRPQPVVGTEQRKMVGPLFRKAALTAAMLKRTRELGSVSGGKTVGKSGEPERDVGESVQVENDGELTTSVNDQEESNEINKMKLEYELEKVKLERRRTELEFARLESTERMKKEELQFKKEMIHNMLNIIKE